MAIFFIKKKLYFKTRFKHSTCKLYKKAETFIKINHIYTIFLLIQKTNILIEFQRVPLLLIGGKMAGKDQLWHIHTTN